MDMSVPIKRYIKRTRRNCDGIITKIFRNYEEKIKRRQISTNKYGRRRFTYVLFMLFLLMGCSYEKIAFFHIRSDMCLIRNKPDL